MCQTTEADMANKRSISRTVLFNLLLVTIISIGFLGGLWTWQQYDRFQRDSTELREMMLTNYKNMLTTQVQRSVDYIEYRKPLTEARLRTSIQEQVDEAYAIARNHYENCKNCKTPQDVQSIIKESLRPMRFDQGLGYFFIVDLEGILQLRGDRPELEGKNLIGSPEGAEARVVQDMIRLCRQQGEGFYRYDWVKPDIDQRVFPKIAFIRLFEPYGWIIGTGAYLDDFETAIEAKHAEMKREMSKSLIQIAAILLGLALFALFTARQTARNVRISFDRFTTFFDKGASESAVIDPGLCHETGGDPRSGPIDSQSARSCVMLPKWCLGDC